MAGIDSSFRPRPVTLAAVALCAGVVLLARSASADFQLQTPTPWIVEDANGDPQSAAPCGVSPNACYQPSGAVTTYVAGQQILLQFALTAANDGWFRVAISYDPDRADLVDPLVTVDGGLSSSAVIEDAPVPPVLSDGVFPHQATDFSSDASDITGLPWVYVDSQVVLPTTPCDACTLQVIEFMNNRRDPLPDGGPTGYFVHHCATVQIVPGDPDAGPFGTTSQPDPDAGPPPSEGCSEAGPDDAQVGSDAGDENASAPDAAALAIASATGGGGCGCATVGRTAAAKLDWLAGAAGLAVLLRRRRTRR